MPPGQTGDSDWRPGADLDTLRARARLLADIRGFFQARGVLEVETPLLAAHGATEPHLASFFVTEADGQRWLQTSPEYHMKRLLAAGSGAIYQLGRAFRREEAGARHNPEFTLLEWYRPGLDYHGLMDEVADLLRHVAPERADFRTVRKHRYGALFQRHLDLDPHRADTGACRRAAERAGIPLAGDRDALVRDDWLDLLMSHVIEPALGRDGLDFVYDYPASQAALARIRPGDPPVAERFELYCQGMELANGFQELTDADEQRARMERECQARREAGLPPMRPDSRLLAALAAGLPDCAGVALGVDRLLMVLLGKPGIGDVLAFPWPRA